MLCLMSFTAIGQRTLSGKITAASSGETLIGVNILIKGTTTGTVTDFDGNPWEMTKSDVCMSNGPVHDQILDCVSLVNPNSDRFTDKSLLALV